MTYTLMTKLWNALENYILTRSLENFILEGRVKNTLSMQSVYVKKTLHMLKSEMHISSSPLYNALCVELYFSDTNA